MQKGKKTGDHTASVALKKSDKNNHNNHKSNGHAKKQADPQKFGREFLIALGGHIVAPFVITAASVCWLFFFKDSSIPWWLFLIFVGTLVFAYAGMISLNYFFPRDFKLSHRLNIHLALFTIFVVVVTTPLAMTIIYTTGQIAELTAKEQKAQDDLAAEKQARSNADSRRIQVSAMITDKMNSILNKPNLDNADIHDLLQYCIQSIALNKPNVHDIRGVIVYLDTTKKRLVIPEQGYYGTGFDREITKLYFDITPKKWSETDEEYLFRIGGAGYAFTSTNTILDDDAQVIKPGEIYRFKPFPASQKDQTDHSLICIGIPNLRLDKTDGSTGVLSISSPTTNLFTQNDVEIARFFATLLSRFKTPVETPRSVLEDAENKIKK